MAGCTVDMDVEKGCGQCGVFYAVVAGFDPGDRAVRAHCDPRMLNNFIGGN
jgi:hypothetical protein